MVLTFAFIRAKSADKMPLYPRVTFTDKSLLMLSIKTLLFINKQSKNSRSASKNVDYFFLLFLFVAPIKATTTITTTAIIAISTSKPCSNVTLLDEVEGDVWLVMLFDKQ